MKIRLVKLAKCPKSIKVRRQEILVVSPVKRYRLIPILPICKRRGKIRLNINYLVW